MIAKRILAFISLCFVLLISLFVTFMHYALSGSKGQSALWSIASELHAPGDTTTQTVASSTVSSAWVIRDEISRMLNQGATKAQIIKHMQDQYGPSVLADPTWQGIGATVWIFPFVILAILVGFVIWTLRARVNRSLQQNAERTLQVDASDRYLDKYI